MQTILIIENDHIIQEAYSEMFHLQGYRVVNSYTAENGLEKLQKLSPDLIVLDMELGGGMTGLAFLIQLKKINKNIPVIVISGKIGMKHDPEITMSKNFHCFFVKPVSLTKLLKEISKIFGCKNSEQAQKNIIAFEKDNQKIAGCIIEEKIGSGAYGEVYKGTYLDTDVAIKILHKKMLSEENIGRFRREASALASIQHKNIIELMYAGKTINEEYYIIMKYFDGKNVGTLLNREQPFSESDAIEMLLQIAEGLKFAHNIDLVHRDVKPSNLLYCEDKKEIKIIDFGLVRPQKVSKVLTKANQTLGTPLYMSPEQCKGQELDLRSDIYSLGATFYHILTGIPPFWREDALDIMIAQVRDDIEWKSGIPVHPILKKMITKMMMKKPVERYNNMKEIICELKKFKECHVSSV